MTDNNDILKAIESIQKDMATRSNLEVIKKDLQDVKQSHAQTNTALEALAAGQKDIRDNMATKADIHRLEQKIDKVDKQVFPTRTRTNPLLFTVFLAVDEAPRLRHPKFQNHRAKSLQWLYTSGFPVSEI